MFEEELKELSLHLSRVPTQFLFLLRAEINEILEERQVSFEAMQAGIRRRELRANGPTLAVVSTKSGTKEDGDCSEE